MTATIEAAAASRRPGGRATFKLADCRARSERVAWKVEDLIGGDKRLDFTKPFLPEALAHVEPLDFLSARERLLLNQIRGYGYARLLLVVEAIILPFVLDHARARIAGDEEELRALLQFGAEEAKHTQLFLRLREQLESGFGSPCDFIGPQEEIVAAVSAHHPLAVSLTVLMCEWMALAHFTEGVKDGRGMDPLFLSLLRNHWLEESQHARIDTLITEAMACDYAPGETAAAVEELLAIAAFIADGLQQQVELDIGNLERASGRALSEPERARFREVQLRSQRRTFLGSGMVTPRFLETLDVLHPDARARVLEVAQSFL